MRQKVFKVSLLKTEFRSSTGGAQNIRRGDPFQHSKCSHLLRCRLTQLAQWLHKWL